MDVLLVVGPGLLLFGVIGFFVLRAQQQAAKLVEDVQAHGWRYVKQSNGFDVEGGEVVPWQLRVRRSSWEIPAPPAEGVVLLGPPMPVGMPSLGGSLVQLALRAILGDEAADLADAVMVDVGEPRFRERFSVIASDRAMAERLLTPEVQGALLGSGLDRLSVLRWKNRLQLRQVHAVRSLDDIQRLEALGQVLAAADAS
jgi:hypothetical protein